MSNDVNENEMAPEKGKPGFLARFGPLAIILVGAGVVFGTGAHRYLSLETLQENYEVVTAFVQDRFWLAMALFMLAYISVTAMSLPGAGLLSIFGGFLFGVWVGTGVVIVSATIGATIIFTAARTALGDALRRKAEGFAARMEKGFNQNAFSYLLLLRVVPIFPFFVVNIVPALFNVSTRTFFLATFIGIIPGTFAYVSAGNGLGAVIESGGELNLSGLLLKPEVITPIIALSVLAMIPLVAKMFGLMPNKEDSE